MIRSGVSAGLARIVAPAAVGQSGGAPPPLDPANIAITYSTPPDKAKRRLFPTENPITTSGPEVDLEVVVPWVNVDSTFQVTLTKLGTPRLSPPAPTGSSLDKDRANSWVATFKVFEVGSYELTITEMAKNGQSGPPDRRIIAFLAEKPTVRFAPRLLRVEESVAGKAVVNKILNLPVEVSSGTFNVFASSPKPNRPMILLNVATGEAVASADGTLVSDSKAAASDPLTLPVSLPDDSIRGRPTEFRAVDRWTMEKSSPVVIVGAVSPDDLPPPGSGVRKTGPNVEFPEFTPPRPETNGFNPSDKVQTRVARLYYYRDAQRVAQIINRDVQSYNQTAVDTRRRQANDARRSGDEATDKRRSQEYRAIRAAQATRAAERQVQQAQAKLDSAARQQSAAKNLQPQLTGTQAGLDDELNAKEAEVADLQARVTGLQQLRPAPPATLDPAIQTQLLQAQADRSRAIVERNNLASKKAATDAQVKQVDTVLAPETTAGLQAQLQSAQADLQAKREAEAGEADQSVADSQVEDRARENQFRQEVAAASENPDTYAAGKPASVDPVRQVSVSVIGEGLIQLRGPLKGINIIRMMIDQIDSPVGQVRVGIHSIQINGEHADRIEKYAGQIQDYLDHSRFLTSQSAQMLRNAIVTVASQKAEEARMEAETAMNDELAACPDDPAHQARIKARFLDQEFRDQKYVRAFFGEDFLEELKAIDSEFLRSGNKLLSIHSMDTTSLASALFVMALAKNQTRLEILETFQDMLAHGLPAAEENYYAAGGSSRTRGKHKKFTLYAGNAKFQSLMGFFNAQVAGTETLSPIQREFIRLAQIFKSRLVVELEYNQRLKERSVIEERLGDYLEELQKQKVTERDADEALARAQSQFALQIQKIAPILAEVNGYLTTFDRTIPLQRSRAVGSTLPLRELFRLAEEFQSGNIVDLPIKASLNGQPYSIDFVQEDATLKVQVKAKDEKTVKAVKSLFERYFALISNAVASFSSQTDIKNFSRGIEKDDLIYLNDQFKKFNEGKYFDDIVPKDVKGDYGFRFDLDKLRDLPKAERALIQVREGLQGPSSTLNLSLSRLLKGSRTPEELLPGVIGLLSTLNKFPNDPKTVEGKRIEEAKLGAKSLVEILIQLEFAQRNRETSRRPLDHKKLLDMLIDDVEDKYIELLEGTRSHTANVDGYIKAVATALDDDFNTQFYYPSFAEVRKAGQLWDVNLGQIETTNVLTNNRGFAKVEPSATMEFDLPKRDIVINEAMNGAKAMIKDYGALVADPNFLALAKLRSGQPTSSLAPGSGGGVNTVRNALPGLPSQNDEKLFSQQGSGDQKLGAAMEALIPDPAVYKFETGTGFEIRPVIQPDGQSVVFNFKYMYTTNVREPVRADEKHLGRVKRHFVDTDVQLGNYELREVSRYQVALKASRTSRGVPLFEDIPGLGILFRPLPSAESSLQENIILAQSTIFPTLFDLMGLRYAPAVADLDTLRLRNDSYIVRGRSRDLANHVFDISSSSVDEFLQVPQAERRPDLYRTQETIGDVHPDGYRGPGLNLRDSPLREGYDPNQLSPSNRFIPSESREAPAQDRAILVEPDEPMPSHPRTPADSIEVAPPLEATLPPSPGGSAFRPGASLTPTSGVGGPGTKDPVRVTRAGATSPRPRQGASTPRQAPAAIRTSSDPLPPLPIGPNAARVEGAKPDAPSRRRAGGPVAPQPKDEALERASTAPSKSRIGGLLSRLRGGDR